MFCLDCFASQSNTCKRYFEALDLDISSLGRGNTAGFKTKHYKFLHTLMNLILFRKFVVCLLFCEKDKTAPMFRAQICVTNFLKKSRKHPHKSFFYLPILAIGIPYDMTSTTLSTADWILSKQHTADNAYTSKYFVIVFESMQLPQLGDILSLDESQLFLPILVFRTPSVLPW